MSELLNYPFMDQLNQKVLDGLPDIDAAEECCAVCIASGIQFLTGKQVSGEELLHAVYGARYIGGTAAIQYVTYVRAKYGVQLTPINGNTAYLVEQIRANVQAGNPVIGTIPSSYAPPSDPFNPGSSHCIAFYKEESGVLSAMNPWHAFSQVGSDAWWEDRLCYGQIWIVTKVKDKKLSIPTGWKDDGKVLTAPNSHTVTEGFRQYVLAHDWHPDDWPLEDAHDYQGGTAQVFKSRRLRWNSKQGVFEEYLGGELMALYAQVKNIKPLAPDTMTALTHALQVLQPLANAYLDIQKAVNP